jgi:large repetitive protein
LYPCTGSGVTLTCGQQGTYQWYKNNVLMIGAAAQYYFANTSGNYSVKVTNANGCGLSSQVYVGINGLPVDITPASSTTICSNDSVKLVASQAGPIQWYLNGIPIANATGSVYYAKLPGSYYVTVNNSAGCGYSGNLFVYVNPAKPPVSWNGTFLNTSTGFSSYQWFLNGNAITGATTPNLAPLATGFYKVSIGGFPCQPVSDDFNLDCNAITIPKPTISWSGNQLSIDNTYSAYQWYLNNSPIPNANSYFTVINQVGVYKVAVVGQLSCSNTSNDFVLTCNEAGPATPPINWNGVQFSTNTGYAAYQWFYNDTAITGATNFSYTPVASKFGKYKVQVTNAFTCSRFSDERFYAPTDIVTIGQARFTYYPNPVKETFFIDVLQSPLKKMTAVVYDLNGKRLLQQNLKNGQNQISVKGLPAGLYHVEILSGNDKSTLKLAVLQ